VGRQLRRKAGRRNVRGSQCAGARAGNRWREGGAGSIAADDWFLDLDPSTPTSIGSELRPVFLAVTTSSNGEVAANIHYRAQDEGTTGSVFVFALAQLDASGSLQAASATSLQPYLSGVLSPRGQSV
jgi:hypothetical protein